MLIYCVILLVLLAVCASVAFQLPPNAVEKNQRISARVDDLLPQTQCQQCGFAGCKPYAEAIARRSAAINQCPPGGLQTANAIAELIGVDRVDVIEPINPTGSNLELVVIDEQACIGCTKCLPVCPVDAIIGAQKQLHIVLAEVCTGCGLCIPPCPVDCITFVPPSPA